QCLASTDSRTCRHPGAGMGIVRDVEIVWDDLIDAFENDDPDLVYIFDRQTGEVFFVPADYEDDAFWQEIDQSGDQYLQVPGFDYEQERLLVHEFIKGVGDGSLKTVLERAFVGKSPYGRLEEILSFYPDQLEKLLAMKESMIADRIRSWLEEHDIYPALATY
ncbi:MAG TPA: UPF0158 family protein, partial [Geobacteraceae bacterium]